MSDSQRALDVTHAALLAMQQNGARPHASAEALAILAATSAPARKLGLPSSQPQMAAPSLRAELSPGNAIRTPLAVSSRHATPQRTAPTIGTKADRLATLRGPVLACTLCPSLVKSRKQVVFGVGNVDAELMFVGDAPSAEDDLVGEPFCGEAGSTLTKIIEAMGFRRSEVYIANVLKCHTGTPPDAKENRKPTVAEIQTCKPYLLEQIRIIQPHAIVALGEAAMEGLLGMEKVAIARERGKWREIEGIPIMPTFHPASFLHTPSNSRKRELWEDMMAVLEKLGRPISATQERYFLPKS